MTIQKFGALIMILGSILFVIAAFMPISMSVFPTSDAAQKQVAIAASLGQWHVSQVLFGLGAIIAALGVWIVAFALREQPFVLPVFVAAPTLTVGAVLWCMHVYQRAVDPQAFVTGALPGWPFVVYTWLTFVSIILIGIAVLNMAPTGAVGWLLVIGPVILAVLYLIFKDMPPFVHYILILVSGIVISTVG
jgi:hypothetical protein